MWADGDRDDLAPARTVGGLSLPLSLYLVFRSVFDMHAYEQVASLADTLQLAANLLGDSGDYSGMGPCVALFRNLSERTAL